MMHKGFQFSQESIEKLRSSHIGKKQPVEHIEKRAAAHRGRKNSPETILKMRASALGRKLSPETRAKISAVQIGKIIPQEVREKISAALKGRPKSQEHIYNAAEARRGKPGVSPTMETRMKLSAALLGRKRPAEVTEKIRKANLGSKSHFYGQPQCNPEGRGIRTPYAGINFRSTWEARFAKALDARGMKWEYEPKRYDLGSCTYLPDFYLPETGAYWEVKGWFDDKSRKRVDLFRKQYPETPLVVVTGEVLRLMEA